MTAIHNLYTNSIQLRFKKRNSCWLLLSLFGFVV